MARGPFSTQKSFYKIHKRFFALISRSNVKRSFFITRLSKVSSGYRKNHQLCGPSITAFSPKRAALKGKSKTRNESPKKCALDVTQRLTCQLPKSLSAHKIQFRFDFLSALSPTSQEGGERQATSNARSEKQKWTFRGDVLRCQFHFPFFFGDERSALKRLLWLIRQSTKMQTRTVNFRSRYARRCEWERSQVDADGSTFPAANTFRFAFSAISTKAVTHSSPTRASHFARSAFRCFYIFIFI